MKIRKGKKVKLYIEGKPTQEFDKKMDIMIMNKEILNKKFLKI